MDRTHVIARILGNSEVPPAFARLTGDIHFVPSTVTVYNIFPFRWKEKCAMLPFYTITGAF